MLIQKNIAHKWAAHVQKSEQPWPQPTRADGRPHMEVLTCPHCCLHPWRTRTFTAEGWTPWQLTAHKCPKWGDKIEQGDQFAGANKKQRPPRRRKEPVAVYTMICR